ncbi:hypothetical protein DV515_00002004, partial [Chloebia gouldiae]
SFDTSMPGPLRRLQTQAKTIGLFRESNHCEYFIKKLSMMKTTRKQPRVPREQNYVQCLVETLGDQLGKTSPEEQARI